MLENSSQGQQKLELRQKQFKERKHERAEGIRSQVNSEKALRENHVSSIHCHSDRSDEEKLRLWETTD